MKHALPLIIAFLLTFSLASAVSIQIATTDYTQGEILTATVANCVAGSVLQINNNASTLIYTRQGTREWSATYNTASDSSDGRYTLFASCEDGTTTEQAFCVDAPGCLAMDEEEEQMELRLTSSAFGNNDAIPADFTCTERDASPPLSIRNIPSTARSVAIIMDDSYNPALPYIHWVLLNIPVPVPVTPTTAIEIPAGSVPSGATVLANEIDTRNRNTYAGPCPPAGETHTYRFTAYALSNPIANPASIQGRSPVLRKPTFENVMGAGIIDKDTLNGLYFPPPVSEASRSGSGGFSCSPHWNCSSQWTYCNATLQQSRTCTDSNRCDLRKLTRLENRSCAACEESWICTAWSNCQNGQQSRSCSDEHACLTSMQKPLLQKSCAATETGPAPVRVEPRLPLPQVQQPLPPVPSFWDSYKLFIIGIPAALIVIALMALGAVHFFKPKQVAYNVEELKEWIRKEQQMGTSQEDIKNILGQHTGWSKDEMEAMFAELGKADKNTAG